MRHEDWGETVGFQCSDCRFYEETSSDENQSIGDCHRFPPREWFAQAEDVIWQKVAGHNWCGEFDLTPKKQREWETERQHRVTGRK